MLRRFDKNFPLRIEFHHLVRRIVAQHVDQRRIHIQKSSVDARSVDSVHGALNERSVAGLRLAERLFMTLVIDRAGELLRNEGQDFLIAFSETHILAITLHHEHSECLTART